MFYSNRGPARPGRSAQGGKYSGEGVLQGGREYFREGVLEASKVLESESELGNSSG